MTDMEKLVEEMADTFVSRVQVYDRFFQKPLFGRKKNKAEQVADYLMVRNDPAAWTGIVQRDGETAARKYAAAMEKLVRQAQEEG